MANQDRGAVLPGEHPLCRGDRFRWRRQRVLHGCGIEACGLQSYDHL